jgi:hypothetical protein
MQERANEEAEAKFGAELRESRRELHKSENRKKEMEEQAEVRLKLQEKEARDSLQRCVASKLEQEKLNNSCKKS